MASTSDSEMTFEELDLSHVKVEVESDSGGSANLSAGSAEPGKQEEKWSISGEITGVSVSVTADEAIYKCRKVSVCCAHAMKEILESKPPPVNFQQQARLQNVGLTILSMINRTYSLLKDYSHMTQHHNSVMCAKFRCTPRTVNCQRCGLIFSDRGSHLLDLMNHINSKHRNESEKLIIGMIDKYHTSLAGMRRMLRADMLRIHKKWAVWDEKWDESLDVMANCEKST